MSSSSAPLSTPEGPGSVSGAPNLPPGFTDTFTSRYIPHRWTAPARGHRRHIPFNRVNHQLTEQLVRGREDLFYGYEFAIQGGKPLPEEALSYYFSLVSDPEVLRGSFGFYRAWDTTPAQNEQRKTRPLPMPVLAIGGADSWGEAVADGIKPAADDVHSVVIAGAGHWVAEQAPQELLAALTTFLTPTATEGESTERRDHYDPGRALHGRYRRSPLPVRCSGRGSR